MLRRTRHTTKVTESPVYIVSATKGDQRARSEMARIELRRMFARTRELRLKKAS
jgi:hypothetical protein